MAEEKPYQPIPYEERPSQKVTWGDYLRKHVSLLLLPIALAGVGYMVGKNIKMTPISEETKKSGGILHAYQTYMQMQFGSENKGQLFAAYGSKIGVIISAFLAWKKKEQKRLEVSDVVESVKEIAPLHQTNEDLEKDNALVKKMIAFEQEKQAKLGHEGASYQQRLASETTSNAHSLQK